MSVHTFQFGDRVLHAEKPEWGEGLVTEAVGAVQDGKACQRVTVRFERAGVKTLSTAYANLKPADTAPVIQEALTNSAAEWLGDLGAKQAQEVMSRLPESATDPFASLEARLKATLGLYRFSAVGGPLIDWAAAQSGLKDPLSRFNRHELEEYYRRFEMARDAHLKKLAAEAQRADPSMLARLAPAAPPAARNALRRVDIR